MNQPGGHHAHYHHQHEPTAGAAGAVVVQASGSTHADHAGGHDHGAMIADYRRRFWVTLVLTPPVLLLSPMIQHWLGLAETISFPGDGLLLFALSTIVYVYGGWRSEEHTSELQSLMRISYAVFCLKKNITPLKII